MSSRSLGNAMKLTLFVLPFRAVFSLAATAADSTGNVANSEILFTKIRSVECHGHAGQEVVPEPALPTPLKAQA